MSKLDDIKVISYYLNFQAYISIKFNIKFKLICKKYVKVLKNIVAA